MAESSSDSVPALDGLAIETVEWLPSGAESGLVRVRGRWIADAARQSDLPVLAVRAAGAEHRFDSLPDARFSRDPASWRGTYLVPAGLIGSEPEALWLEWASGARAGLPTLSRGVEPPAVPGAAERVPPPEEPGGQVIDRAVLAERRARRAEASERQQSRVAAEAVKAVEVLELRSAELERRLEEAQGERDALAAHEGEAGERREELAAALASAAALRARSREWQLHLRASEVTRAGDAVRLAVLEAERAKTVPALRAALLQRTHELTAARAQAEEARAAVAEATAARAALTAAEERVAAERAAWEPRRSELEAELAAARTDLARTRDDAAAALSALERRAETAEARLRVETVARTTLEDELDRERAGRAAAARLHSELEAERTARRAAEGALREANRTGATLQDQVAELERRAATGREELERLAREHAVAPAAHEAAADATRLVADLDAAQASLRSRAADPPGNPGPDSADPSPAAPEPGAPDCEPAVEWSDSVEPDATRAAVPPGVEPVRAPTEATEVEWAPPEFVHDADAIEPPAPDAEPFVESAPPVVATPPPAPAAGPRIVPASGPPPRALMLGTERRDYPRLRGAIVKLAHDDPALAGRVLAALLPAQGAVLAGPLRYDLTIAGTGTFGIAIAGGRATVEPLTRPRSRRVADFHLAAEPLLLAELLAGIDHRIGRFFGPIRVRGRKGRVQALRPLQSRAPTLSDAARAGAALDPELVYRMFAYAVHPSWTRGHAFTVAQTILDDPPRTWYLTARDGAGLTVSTTPADPPPAATVSMTRKVFDQLLRGEAVAAGERPDVRGDRDAVALMHSWTQRAR